MPARFCPITGDEIHDFLTSLGFVPLIPSIRSIERVELPEGRLRRKRPGGCVPVADSEIGGGERMTAEWEMAALEAIEQGESVEYEVIPL
jgi:hypothetical protein